MQSSQMQQFSSLGIMPILRSYTSLLYPIIAGFFGFAATAIGSHFFNLTNSYMYIGLGIVLFVASNHFLYKLKFNSYHSNGSTVTTILVFVSQVVCMGIYKKDAISIKWIIGVAFVLIGTVLIQGTKSKNAQQQAQQVKESKIVDMNKSSDNIKVMGKQIQGKQQ